MKKALFFILLPLVISSTPAFADCASAVKEAKQQCSQKEDEETVDTSTCAPVDGVADWSSQGTCANDQAKAKNAAFYNRCNQPAEDCVKACSKSPKNLKTCQEFKKRADDAKNQSGANDQASKQSQNSGQQGGSGGMPQMPQQQQDQSSPSPSPSPSAVAAPASAVDCTANPADPSCSSSQKQVTDSANLPSPAAFQGDSGGGGGGSSSSSPTMPSYDSNSPTSAAGTSPMPMVGSGGGGGSFGSNNNANNKDLSPQAYADAAKNITDVLNGERGGGGGGAAGGAGGFSGYGSGEAMNLSSYLPGGSRDPARKLASVAKKTGSMEIASVHENIFSMITKRIQILCKLKEIRDCD